MVLDCLPPHARALPVLIDGGRTPCHDCQSKIASLEGLLLTTRNDLALARAEVIRLRVAARTDAASLACNIATLEAEIQRHMGALR